MARRTNKALMERVFSPSEMAEYARLNITIAEAQKQADGLARTIAGALSRVKAKKLFEIEGYKNIYEYGEQMHGIARGTVSDAINVYERFQNPANKGHLLPEFEPFAWRALIMMKSIPDNDSIHRLGITYDMKSAEIKQRVMDYKEAAELIELKGDWNYDTIKQAIEDSKAIPVSGEEQETSNSDTADNSSVNTEDRASETPETPENEGEDYATDYVAQARNMMTPEEWEEFEENESADLYQACADYVQNFNEFPKRTINIADMSDKDAIAAIKALLSGVRNNEYDIIITA